MLLLAIDVALVACPSLKIMLQLMNHVGECCNGKQQQPSNKNRDNIDSGQDKEELVDDDDNLEEDKLEHEEEEKL